jgi:hypothetical protein
MSRSLSTALAALAHRAEGHCLLEGQISSNEKSLRLLGGTRRLNIFQKKSAGFKTTIDLNKSKMIQVDVSVYVKIVDLISVRHQYKYMEHEA